jgi:hypothetical protein
LRDVIKNTSQELQEGSKQAEKQQKEQRERAS